MNKKAKKVVNGVVVGTMLFSIVNLTSAANVSETVEEETVYEQNIKLEDRKDNLKTSLDNLVEKEIISQEQAINITEKLAEYKDEMIQHKKDIIQEKVENGDITQEQADKILERMENFDKPRLRIVKSEVKRKLNLEEKKSILDEKLENEEITKEQYDKIIDRMDELKDKDGLNGRKRIGDFKEKLEEKLENGEITQDQYDKIKSRMEDKISNRKNRLETVLEKLVEDDVISKQQSEEILKHITEIQ